MYVKISPNYYAGTLGVPTVHYATTAEVTGDERDPMGEFIHTFDTREEAEAWIAEQEEGAYCLAHGEAGRPEYTILEVFPDVECDSGKGENFAGYEEVDASELSDEIKASLDADGVEDDGHGRYIADKGDLRVCYIPRSEALQRHADDLGDLIWDNPGYYIREGCRMLQRAIWFNDRNEPTRDHIVYNNLTGKYSIAIESCIDLFGSYDTADEALQRYANDNNVPIESYDLDVDGWFSENGDMVDL